MALVSSQSPEKCSFSLGGGGTRLRAGLSAESERKHIRHSRPDHGLGLKAKFYISLGGGGTHLRAGLSAESPSGELLSDTPRAGVPLSPPRVAAVL